MQIKNKKDFISGIMLFCIGLTVLLVARGYRLGTAFRMGPGYFPVALSILLIALGLIMVGMALKSGKEEAIPKLAWRPVLVVAVAVALFGLFIDSAGLIVMTFVMSVVSRFSRPRYPWVETVILSVVLSATCAAIFYFGLNVQMPLLPTWLNF